LARGNLELVLVISSVGQGLADVPLHPACPQDGSRGAHGDRILRGQDADALRAAHPDAVFSQQLLVLVDLVFQVFREALNVFLELIVSLVLQTTDAEGVRREPRPAILLENLKNLLALAEAVENGRERADIERVRAEPEQVTGDALKLGEDRADHLGAGRRLDAHQLFNRLAIAQAVRNRGDIVHAVHIRRKLLIAAVLSNLLHAAVQVANDALGI